MSIKGNMNSSYRLPIEKLGTLLTWKFILGVFLLVLFVKLVEDLSYHELGTFDTLVGNFILSYATERLTGIAIVITQTGSTLVDIVLMFVIGGYLLIRLKQFWETVALTTSLTGSWLLNTVLKDIFHRTRPDVLHLVTAGGYSFPSGHAMISTSFYGMLCYLLCLNLRDRSKPSWYVVVLTFGLITAIGVSRIYLGVHFPSDVIAGFAAGGVWLIVCITGLQKIRYYRNNLDF